MSVDELMRTKGPGPEEPLVHVRKEDVIEILKALEAFKRMLLSLIKK